MHILQKAIELRHSKDIVKLRNWLYEFTTSTVYCPGNSFGIIELAKKSSSAISLILSIP